MKKLLMIAMVVVLSGLEANVRYSGIGHQVEDIPSPLPIASATPDYWWPELTLTGKGKSFAKANYYPDDKVVSIEKDGKMVKYAAIVGAGEEPQHGTVIGHYQQGQPVTGEKLAMKYYVAIDPKDHALAEEYFKHGKNLN